MQNLQNIDLTINLSMEDAAMKLVWLGKSTEADPGSVLNPYLDEVIQEAKENKKKLVVDFSELEYMNSSTIPPIMRMVTNMEKEGIEASIVYKGDLKWQVASFKALENVVKIRKFQLVAIQAI